MCMAAAAAAVELAVVHRQLRLRKGAKFWSRNIDTDQADPGSLQRSVDIFQCPRVV